MVGRAAGGVNSARGRGETLTIILKIVLENTDDFRWLAMLLGTGQSSPPREIEIQDSKTADAA